MKEVIIQWALFIGFVALVSGVVATVLIVAIDRSEVVECYELERYSEQFDEFYVVDWQKQMCDQHGFTFAGSERAPLLILPGGEFDTGIWYYYPSRGKFKMDAGFASSTEDYE